MYTWKTYLYYRNICFWTPVSITYNGEQYQQIQKPHQRRLYRQNVQVEKGTVDTPDDRGEKVYQYSMTM